MPRHIGCDVPAAGSFPPSDLLFSRHPYETAMHALSEESTNNMMQFLECCKARGISVRDIRRDEMHVLVTAYNAALLEPIAHGYDRKDAERYLKTIVEFLHRAGG